MPPRAVLYYAGILLTLSCARPAPAPPPATAASAPHPSAATGESEAPAAGMRSIRVRPGAMSETGPVFAGVFLLDEAPAPDGSLSTVALAPASGGDEVRIETANLREDVVYAVVLFTDADGDGRIDKGENLRGTNSRADRDRNWRGEGIFLITPKETFVGQAPWNLDEVFFVPAERL